MMIALLLLLLPLCIRRRLAVFTYARCITRFFGSAGERQIKVFDSLTTDTYTHDAFIRYFFILLDTSVKLFHRTVERMNIYSMFIMFMNGTGGVVRRSYGRHMLCGWMTVCAIVISLQVDRDDGWAIWQRWWSSFSCNYKFSDFICLFCQDSLARSLDCSRHQRIIYVYYYWCPSCSFVSVARARALLWNQCLTRQQQQSCFFFLNFNLWRKCKYLYFFFPLLSCGWARWNEAICHTID